MGLFEVMLSQAGGFYPLTLFATSAAAPALRMAVP